MLVGDGSSLTPNARKPNLDVMKLFYQYIALVLAVMALPCQTLAKPLSPATVPVTVGAEAELNACTSIGHGKAVLIVRAAPSLSARAVASLAKIHLIWICEQRDNAKWYGIVYGPAAASHSKTGLPPACGVNDSIAKPKAYRGPCKSGWVPADAVKTIAG